ncbi:DDE-type integrase/transposase/recombinase [uncultured Microbulbifer sp.]|uniref:DDE-type integrase/transposase/recombinase n=1 Tax=uncultured Microbulbifer sp. TaxID=348147 RepID=UPI002606D2B7|nr:DDE-type integrase/transposase/recombinase [uncultured Microbulbifer sp.]
MSSDYHWCRRSNGSLDTQEWQRCHRLKVLFEKSRQSPGSRRLMKLPHQEGIAVGRYRFRRLIKKPGLTVRRKKRFTLTTDRKHQLPAAENLLNRDFSSRTKSQAWTTDLTYIWNFQGWLYLAIVIDLHSLKIVGWHLDLQIEPTLVSRALVMVVNLRTPLKVFCITLIEVVSMPYLPNACARESGTFTRMEFHTFIYF